MFVLKLKQMNTKLTVGMIAITGVMLALSSIVSNQASASSFPGENGQGHKQTCSKGNSGSTSDGPCPGNSGGNGNTETTNAGNSHVVKDKDCGNPPNACSEDEEDN
jgi:hypothetical protein